jgi:peptide/nickel transport system permease protein
VGTAGYLGRKVLHALLTLWFVISFNFILFRVMPGDPIGLLARSQHLSRQDQEEQRANLGLDLPLPQQYVRYMADTLTGKFGLSVRQAKPVTEMIAERVTPSLLLVGLGTVFSTVIGVLIGIRGAWKRGSFFDKSTLYGSLALYSMPEGWLGMLLLLLFGGTVFHFFPAGGYRSAGGDLQGLEYMVDVGKHLFLPVLTLTLGYVGEYAIIMRASLVEMMGEDFVQTARAKGVPDRLVRRRHAVPNAFLPTFTLIFLSFGFLLGGAIVVETVFSFPGMGLLAWEAANELDFPVLQAFFLLSSGMVIIFNLIADVTYGYLDPRIRAA